MKLVISIIVSAIVVIGLAFFILGEDERKDLPGDRISGRIPGLVASEELILELTKELKAITRDLQNFNEPAPDSDSLEKLTSGWTNEVDFFDSV